MADSAKSKADLLAGILTGVSQNVSAQDIRDFLVSVYFGSDVTSETGRAFVNAGTNTIIKDKLDATEAPAVSNDSSEGYQSGSLWVDINNDNVYLCTDASAGAANWADLTAVLLPEYTGSDPSGLPDGTLIYRSDL